MFVFLSFSSTHTKHKLLLHTHIIHPHFYNKYYYNENELKTLNNTITHKHNFDTKTALSAINNIQHLPYKKNNQKPLFLTKNLPKCTGTILTKI